METIATIGAGPGRSFQVIEAEVRGNGTSGGAQFLRIRRNKFPFARTKNVIRIPSIQMSPESSAVVRSPDQSTSPPHDPAGPPESDKPLLALQNIKKLNILPADLYKNRIKRKTKMSSYTFRSEVNDKMQTSVVQCDLVTPVTPVLEINSQGSSQIQ